MKISISTLFSSQILLRIVLEVFKNEKNTVTTAQTPQTIVEHIPPVQANTLEKFRKAIGLAPKGGFPPTFATLYRQNEFEWLKIHQVSLSDLLHAEQGYEYVSDFQLGEPLTVETKITSLRERKNWRWIAIESVILSDNAVRVRVSTTFVVKKTT